MNDSIFTKIIKGEIPSHKVYEDDKIIAFLDINPATEGHTLVVPKKQVEFIWDLEEDDYQALMRVVQQVGAHYRTVSGRPYVGQLVVGTDVPHTHVHVIPFHHAGELKRGIEAASREPDHEALAAVAVKYRLS